LHVEPSGRPIDRAVAVWDILRMRGRRRIVIGLGTAVLAAGCGGAVATASHNSGAAATVLTSYHGKYRDPAGWTVEVPPSWHLVRFHGSKGGVSAAGAQLSNIRLPAPTVIPGYPIQSPLGRRPARGVGLVIATDTETGLPGRSPGRILTPPLPTPDQHGWSVGSAYSGNPYIETLWFRGNHQTFIASVKVGAKATHADLATIDSIIHSLRFRHSRH
jgi:hypothetical protein